MSKKKKILIIAAGLLATAGAVAAVKAQGHRWGHGGPMQFGMGGGDGPGMGMGKGGGGGRFGGPITKDEFNGRTRERFARLDRNSDGVIDTAEIEATFTGRMDEMRRRFGGQGQSMGPRMAERMIRYFDANKDGKVSKDEYQAGIKAAFAEFDLNNDGKITDDDLPPMMRGRNVLAEGGRGGPGFGGSGMGRPGMGGEMGGMGGGPLMRLIRDADANKDGVITLDEVIAAADKRFTSLDRTKDGTVDKADFDAMRKEMVDYRVKRFIHHFGGDKDGKVTREQFTAKAAERFARMDLNDDGTIGRDEMPGRGRWSGGGGERGRWFGRGGGDDQMGPGGPGGPGGMERGGPGGPGQKRGN